MKHIFAKRIFSMLLALVMVIGLLPLSALSVAADEPMVINEIKTQMAKDNVPRAGMEVTHFMPNVPDGEPYERPWNGAEWYDSNGVIIAPRINHYYDRGYEFEAGRTYYVDYLYTADDGYVFAQNPIINFMGPDPSMFTYKIVDRWKNNRGITVRYTFTIPGEFDYPDINKVSMMYYGPVAEGYKKRAACEMIYNNCTITREEWNTGSWGSEANWGVYTEDDSNAPTYLAGERYVHMIELTANDGYKFSSGLHVQKGTQDEEEYGVVSLSADRRVATVKFIYDVGAYEFIDTIELVPATQHVAFMLHIGESIYLPQPFGAKYALADDCPYTPDGGSNYTWVVDETGEHLHLGYPHSFELGKKYTLKFAVRIKDEYVTTHKFVTNPNLVVSDYVYAKSDNVQFKISGGGQIVNVEVTFTAQFPKGAGETANNPVICTNYAELKYALEHPDIRFIRVDSFQNSTALNYYILTEGEDYVKGNSAITIPSGAVKNLELNTDINLRATQINGLMYSFIYNRGSLYISGTGSLNVSFNAAGYISAIILNDGYLQTTGITLDGTNYSFDRQHGYAIVNYNGDTVIYGGTYIGYKSAAVSYDRGSLVIYGGDFQVKEATSDDFALNANGYLTAEEHNVTLYGGTFEGIKAGHQQNAANDFPMLRDLLAYNGYFVRTDDTTFNAGDKLETDETLTVKLYPLVEEVELTVTAPKEGAKPDYHVGDPSEYYNADYSSNDDSDYVKWFMSSDGDDWWEINENHTFMAGYYYKVFVDVITQKHAMYPLTPSWDHDVAATVNGHYATVKKTYDQDPSHSLTVEYNFGECNDSVVEKITIVDVKQPVAGERPDYTANVLGTGYGINTDMNDYTDVYWLNPAEKWYFIKNGIGWWDVTEEDWVYEHEAFIPGHEYEINVYLITEDGYEFTYDKYYENTSTATVNGNMAEAVVYYNDWTSQREVEYTFTCEKKNVSTIMIYGLDAPRAGEHPDYTATVAYPEVYQIDPNYAGTNGIVWYDSQGNMLFPEDTFVQGEKYRVEIKIVPVSVDGTNVCQFVQPVVAYVSNTQVVPNGDWDSVTGNANALYVLYTFPEGAAAPATPTYIPGDVDGNGVVNVRDLGRLQQYLNGFDVTINEAAANVDGNTSVNVRDLGCLQQYLNGFDVELK